MNQNDRDVSEDELIQSYLEKEATPPEEEQFRLLLANEAFCRRVAEYAIDHGHLYDCARQGMLETVLPTERKPVPLNRRPTLAVAVTAASLLVTATAAWWMLRESGREVSVEAIPGTVSEEGLDPVPSAISIAAPDQRTVVARVGRVAGQVLMGGEPNPQALRTIEGEMELRSGDVLRTVGAESFAVLKFDDGSVVAVAGGTDLTCSVVGSQKRLDVRNGDIMAQVTRQSGKPMVINTPAAEAEVVGTRLSLFANLVLTELAVQEGHVRLRRFCDDRCIDVKEGQCVVASKASKMVPEPIAPASNGWEEDFELRWPDRWRAGHWVHYGLPLGSKGAALAEARDEGDGPCFISTANEWSRGLFRIEDDTHLNLTYKLKRPGWFYVMVETRSEGHGGDYCGNYMFQTPGIWKIPRNKWRTVSIPLSDFHEPPGGRPKDATLLPPNTGNVVFSLLLRTRTPDPGLFVDRIWVTRGAPESAEVLRLQK